jgi:hypothetical protein
VEVLRVREKMPCLEKIKKNGFFFCGIGRK